jgi:hypothetical protein
LLHWASRNSWIIFSTGRTRIGLLSSSFDISPYLNLPTQPLSKHGILSTKQDTNRECKRNATADGGNWWEWEKTLKGGR